jgi:hypothetical protein
VERSPHWMARHRRVMQVAAAARSNGGGAAAAALRRRQVAAARVEEVYGRVGGRGSSQAAATARVDTALRFSWLGVARAVTLWCCECLPCAPCPFTRRVQGGHALLREREK